MNIDAQIIPDELPEELQLLVEMQDVLEKKKEIERQRQLNELSKIIAKKRDEVVKARRASGIEKIWQEDQENYEGIDEYNKTGFQPKYTKSRSIDGGIIANTAGNKNDNQCTAFFNITRQFVDSASARMGDILGSDWNWGIKKTPKPKYVGEKGMTVDQQGNVLQGYDQEAAEHAKKEEAAETRLKDWLTETKYHTEYRKMTESAARIGSGVIKGPYPKKRATKVFYGGSYEIIEEVVPASKVIDVWDFFPDYPNCGEDIQDGEFVFERDYITAKDLNGLAESPELGYFPDAIKKVIEEGPGKKHQGGQSRTQNDDMFEVWYYTGWLDVSKTQLFSYEEVDSESRADFRMFTVVMVNDTIIKGSESLADDSFPYDVMVWQRVANMPWGIGVSRQMREAQLFMTASARNLVDNMGLSSIPMIAMRRQGIEPEDRKWEIRKGKVWWMTDEMIKNVNESIQFITIPTMQNELVANIQLATKMAEDATGINFLLQGQQGSAPDTVGGMELLHRNASALLRRIGRVSDEQTERHINRYYGWLLLYGDDSEKCDLQIQAIGSSALVEREMQAMQAEKLLQLATIPGTDMSLRKTADEIIKGWKLEPSRFKLDEDEKKNIQQSDPAPAVQAAQIRAETELKKAEMNNQMVIQKTQADTDRDALFQQSVAQRNQLDYEYKLRLLEQENTKLQLQKELALLDYSVKQQMSLDDIKAKLASDTMKINLQRELAVMTETPPQVLTPPTEPQGRAPIGEAYQK